MANERTTETTTEEQRSQPRQEGQGSQRHEMARRTYDPLGSSLMPISMFPTPFSLLNPFSLLRSMTEDIERIPGRGRGVRGDMVWSPAIEVIEQDGNCVVRAELPGMKPDEVTVEVVDDAVIIEGERKFEREDEQSGVRRSERMYGRFYRIVPLPDGANPAEAKARVQDGMLEITVPVAQRQSNRREIPIESSATRGAASSSRQQSSQQPQKT